MTILDTLPKLPWRVVWQTTPTNGWYIEDANGQDFVSDLGLDFTFDQAQALVTAMNSYGAMVEALREIAALDDVRADEAATVATRALALIEEKK